MPDEIDRDQEFNEQRLEEMIEQNRFKPATTPSLYYCRLCGEPIRQFQIQARPHWLDQFLLKRERCRPSYTDRFASVSDRFFLQLFSDVITDEMS